MTVIQIIFVADRTFIIQASIHYYKEYYVCEHPLPKFKSKDTLSYKECSDFRKTFPHCIVSLKDGFSATENPICSCAHKIRRAKNPTLGTGTFTRKSKGLSM